MSSKSKLIKDVYYNLNKSKCESADFILAVKNNPALYDPYNIDYKMATTKEAIWKELANRFGVTCDVAKKRWKSLRDTYTKKYRISEENAANFKYGKELEFLKPYMKNERSRSTIPFPKASPSTKSNASYKTQKNDMEIEEYRFQETFLDLSEKDFLPEFDTKIFISQVQCHACIWNQNISTYNIEEERNRAWLSVGKNLVEDFEHIDQETQNKIVKILRRKWRRLRERYFSIKKIIKTRLDSDPNQMFPFFCNLKFIDHGLKSNGQVVIDEYKETDSGFSLSMKAEYLSDSQMNENDEESEVVYPHETESTISENPEQQITNYEDEDRLFLLSLVKEMKKIPKDHKLDARLNILVVLRNWQKMHFVPEVNVDDSTNILN